MISKKIRMEQKFTYDTGGEGENIFGYDLDAIGSIRKTANIVPKKDENGITLVGKTESYFRIEIIYKYFNKVDTLHFGSRKDLDEEYERLYNAWNTI